MDEEKELKRQMEEVGTKEFSRQAAETLPTRPRGALRAAGGGACKRRPRTSWEMPSADGLRPLGPRRLLAAPWASRGRGRWFGEGAYQA